MAEVRVSTDQIETFTRDSARVQASTDSVESLSNTVTPAAFVSVDQVEFFFSELTQLVEATVDQLEHLYEGPLVSTLIPAKCMTVTSYVPGPRRQQSVCE